MKQFVAEIPAHVTPANLSVVDVPRFEGPEEDAFLNDVVAGLGSQPKTIPAKYFYDRHGSELFDAICRLPEYYPTRTEMALLRTHGPEIAALAGSGAHVIEFGSGSSAKVRLLLDALQGPASYVAVDISREYLVHACEALAADHPALAVIAVCADFTQPFPVPALPGPGPRVGFFPGSTIGNLIPSEAEAFLRHMGVVVGPGGGVIIGVDLKKDIAILNAAYNDAAGVTAAFNLNLLTRMNRELGLSVTAQSFDHMAAYNADEGRIEMHLISRVAQEISLRDRTFTLAEGERIHTENSYKYALDEFQSLARSAGLRPLRAWVDPDRLFSIHYLGVPR